MNLAEFLARREAQAAPPPRAECPQCRKALPTCYCAHLRPFVAPAEFVILQHENEARNAIATARMAHLSIKNSQLFAGWFFANDARVEAALARPERQQVLLYPGAGAESLESLLTSRGEAAPPLSFWVLDAKWSQVPKMLRLSPNVRRLPMVSFAPTEGSRFLLRRQPDPACLSTIEAIFFVIDHLLQRRQDSSQEHHALLEVFQYLVQQQLGFVDPVRDTRHKAAREQRALRTGRARAKIANKANHKSAIGRQHV